LQSFPQLANRQGVEAVVKAESQRPGVQHKTALKSLACKFTQGSELPLEPIPCFYIILFMILRKPYPSFLQTSQAVPKPGWLWNSLDRRGGQMPASSIQDFYIVDSGRHILAPTGV
jgi:hypothetical protein